MTIFSLRSLYRRGLGLVCPVLSYALLFSCAPAPELTAFERAAVHAAEEGWARAGLTPCKVLPAISIARLDANSFAHACVGYPYACSHGWLDGVIYYRPGLQTDAMGEPIIHELMHIQQHCSGRGGDPQHTDPLVWIAAGGESSAQGRARLVFTSQE